MYDLIVKISKEGKETLALVGVISNKGSDYTVYGIIFE
jgi:hypothetical protein